jgi:hypothetical protein
VLVLGVWARENGDMKGVNIDVNSQRTCRDCFELCSDGFAFAGDEVMHRHEEIIWTSLQVG